MWLIDAFTASAVSGGTSATCSAISLRRLLELGARHDAIHEPVPLGVGRAELLRAEQELLRLARPELPRLDEQLDADARHAQHRIREPRVVGRDDQVAHAREHEPGGGARSLHRRDRRLAQVADLHELVEVHDLLVAELAFGRGAHRRPVFLAREQLLEVVTGGEVLALGREHDDPDRVVGVGAVERGVELVDHLAVLRVGRFGTVQRDRGDRAVDGVPDGERGIRVGGVGHAQGW